MSMLSRFATTGGGGDPYWNNVSLLLVGNGANGTNTNIVDSSKNNVTLTPVGGTVISTTQSKYGSGSVYFNGSSQSVTTPSSALFNFGAGDFTIEGWVYASATGYGPIINWQNVIFQANRPVIYLWNTGVIVWYANSGALITGTTNIVGLGWVYIAISKSSNATRLYVNGLQEGGTYSDTITYEAPDTTLKIGSFPTAAQYYNGYIYDLRVTKGVARYTGSTMTVPTAPLPTS